MNSKKLFGINFSSSPGLKEKIIISFKQKKELERVNKDPNLPLLDFSNFDDLTSEDNLKHYYITTDVLQIATRIKLPVPYNLSWLKDGAEGKKQFNYGDSFLRYRKINSNIYVMTGTIVKNFQDSGFERVMYSVFNFDLAAEEIYMGEDETEFAKASLPLFLQLYSFIEMTDIEEVQIRPGKWSGTRKDKDQLKNEELFPIVTVKTNWVKILVRNEAFSVAGHIRFQPYGPNNSLRKPIWINPYEKKGYTLRAGKMIDEQIDYDDRDQQ
jgi:hypothetical protein